MARIKILFVFLSITIAQHNTAFADIKSNLKRIQLPPGFSISIYAHVPGARSITVIPELDAVIVGTRGDKVYRISDPGLDGNPDNVSVLVENLNSPNGVGFTDGKILIAEQHRIISLNPETNEIALELDGLPDKQWHGWRYMAVNSQGDIFVTIGAPCNVCALRGIEGSIIKIDNATGEMTQFATGIRNSVGMDFHPKTGHLYFTDNGSDNLGDDIPPDELNYAPEPNLNFGFPRFGGGDTQIERFANYRDNQNSVFPIVNFQAHAASLGIHFYRGKMFSPEFKTSAFVAQHGSWNRSTPTGYRIMRLNFDNDGKFLNKSIFAEGWLEGEESWGRVVDVKELPDGSLLVSDDYAGVIYHITYKK